MQPLHYAIITLGNQQIDDRETLYVIHHLVKRGANINSKFSLRGKVSYFILFHFIALFYCIFFFRLQLHFWHL